LLKSNNIIEKDTGVTVLETLFLALYKSGILGLHHSQGHVQPPRLSHPNLWLSADPENLRIDFHSGSCSKATPYSIFLFSVSETVITVPPPKYFKHTLFKKIYSIRANSNKIMKNMCVRSHY